MGPQVENKLVKGGQPPVIRATFPFNEKTELKFGISDILCYGIDVRDFV